MAKFYFAFVNSTDKTFDVSFKRNDAEVFSFDLVHDEGQFPRLEIEIKHPRVGLLSPGRKQWCWLSYENGSLFQPLFFGRMIGTPQDIQNEIIKLSFLAKPTGFQQTKTQIANTWKFLPFYDPIWIAKDKRNDPEIILETIPKLWHIDRVTHNVSLSNINIGEDGTLNVGDDFFYDSFSINFSTLPLMRIDVEGTVSWTESVSGSIDISSKFPYPLSTYTPGGLLNDWPEAGTSIGGNWYVDGATVTKANGTTFPENLVICIDVKYNVYSIAETALAITQRMRYEADRQRQESVRFSLYGDIQNIYSDQNEEQIEKIVIQSDNIDKPVDEGLQPPLVQGLKRTFFKTTRGRLALEYLIAVAKTRLMARARSVEVSAEIEFEKGINLSCRKNILITDTRAAVGNTFGKVISYTLYANGEGKLGCKFTIGCTIGKASIVAPSAGSASYVNDGYVNNYQYSGGQVVPALCGGVTYLNYMAYPIADDGIDFNYFDITKAVNSVSVTNPASTQIQYISYSKTAEENTETINQHPTKIKIIMNPIKNGPFFTPYQIMITGLNIPKTIDLEAA